MYMDKACQILGIEMDKPFIVTNSNDEFVLRKDGLYYLKCGTRANIIFHDIFSGIVKIKWKPNLDDTYYIPSVMTTYFDSLLWHDNFIDRFLYDSGVVCRTKEEAVEMTKKMIDAIK